MLLICFGEVIKFFQYLLDFDKCYCVIVKFGQCMDIFDVDGQVVEECLLIFCDEQLVVVLDSFCGEMQQVLLMYLVLKYQGKKLYEYVCQGIEVLWEVWLIIVYELLFICCEGDELELEIYCLKGIYIWMIIDDLGEKFGCGVYVIFLCCLVVSKYLVEWMVIFEQLQVLVDEVVVQDIFVVQLFDLLLMLMDSLVLDYLLVNILEIFVVYFKNGNLVCQLGVLFNGLVWVMESEFGKFFGMGEIDDEGCVVLCCLVVEYLV